MKVLLPIVSLLVVFSDASKIFIVAPFYGTSHAVVIQTIGLHLAERGHDVTVITYRTVENPPKNYVQIKVDLHPMHEQDMDHFTLRNLSSFGQMSIFNKKLVPSLDLSLSTPAVQDFIRNDKTKFDLVISEIFFEEATYMFAHKYKAPLILVGTSTFYVHSAEFMGVPLPYNYVYHDQIREVNVHKGNPYEKLWLTGMNMVVRLYEMIQRKLVNLKEMEPVAAKHFGHLPGTLPSLEELQKNVAMIFFNTHFSYDQVLPLVPGVVEIGGVHLKPSKPLEKELQKFLDEARDGVIYFSLGSHLKSSKMSPDRIASFVKVFSRMKQRVLWKWEDDEYPTTSKNIFFKKWFPQADVLSHPNIKVFINHGGMLSVQEAVHNGVPIIGIPIFADQYRNIRLLADKKMAVDLDYQTINEQTIQDALDSILKNEEYSRSAKTISKIFRDRQNSPLETVAYWVEYVIRHKNATILKPPTVYMGYLDYYSTEVVLIMIFICGLFIGYVLYEILKIIIKSFKRSPKTKRD